MSAETGRAARAGAPRSAHARWEAGPERPDPVVLLELQARTRIPDLVPLRYRRMLASPMRDHAALAAAVQAGVVRAA